MKEYGYEQNNEKTTKSNQTFNSAKEKGCWDAFEFGSV